MDYKKAPQLFVLSVRLSDFRDTCYMCFTVVFSCEYCPQYSHAFDGSIVLRISIPPGRRISAISENWSLNQFVDWKENYPSGECMLINQCDGRYLHP